MKYPGYSTLRTKLNAKQHGTDTAAFYGWRFL